MQTSQLFKTMSFMSKCHYTPQSPYAHRVKFLGKRSLLELGQQQAKAIFKFSLSDFKHTQSTFQRRHLTQEEIDAINNGGEEVTYKHIPKIKNRPIEDDA